MKKFIYILIAILTFSLGFWLYSYRALVTPVSLCEISQHSQIFQSNKIHIKANLEVFGIEDSLDDYIVSDFKSGCLTGAALEFSDDLKERIAKNEKFKQTIEQLRARKRETVEKRDGRGFYWTEVEIVGEIKKNSDADSHDIAGLIEPLPFIIRAENIENISPIKFVSVEEFQEMRGK